MMHFLNYTPPINDHNSIVSWPNWKIQVPKVIWVDEEGLRASVTSSQSLISAKWTTHHGVRTQTWQWPSSPQWVTQCVRCGDQAGRGRSPETSSYRGNTRDNSTGGGFSLYVRGNYWVVTSCSSRVGDDCHLWSRSAPSLCQARHQTLRDLIEHPSGSLPTKQTNWGYNKRWFITWSNDISATCHVAGEYNFILIHKK